MLSRVEPDTDFRLYIGESDKELLDPDIRPGIYEFYREIRIFFSFIFIYVPFIPVEYEPSIITSHKKALIIRK